jgi:hypothetical protein
MSTPLVALMAVLAAAIYSCIVSYFYPDKLWDWLNTLVGSFLSFFLAMISGIWLYNKQSQLAAEKSKQEMKTVLASELSDLHRILTSGEMMPLKYPSGKTDSVLVTFVQPITVEKAAQSSLFSSRDTENLLHLARKVRMFQLIIEHFLGLLRSGAKEEYIAHTIRNSEETRQALIADIRQISDQMQL